MPDVAELGVRVTLDGAQPAAQALDNLTASADKAESSTRRLGGASDGLTASQRFLMQQGIQLDAVLSRVNGETATLAVGTGAVTEAVTEEAVAHEVAGRAAGVHGLNLGRLNMELGTATGRILGLNTAMTRFGAMLGGSVGGYPQMIAITLAIVAAGEAWKHFSEEARKAQEQQDKNTESLKKWYDEQVNGGKRAMEVASAQKDLADQQQKLVDLQAKQGTSDFSSTRNLSRARDLAEQITATRAKIAEDQRLIAAGSGEVAKTEAEAFDQQMQRHGQALAELLKFNATDAGIRAQANAQLKQDLALEAQYRKAGMIERAAEYAQMAKALEDAIDPKVHLSTPGSAAGPKNDTITALDKQLEEMRKVSVEENIANVQRENEIKLVGMVGYVHDLLVAQQKAEIETIKALSTLSGIALKERLATIQADEDADIAKAKLVRTLKEELETRQMLNDITKDVTRIGKQNEATEKAEIDAAAQKIKDAQAYQDKLETIARNGIERIVSHGMKSYQDFFGDVLKTFSSMMDAMEAEAKKHNTTPGTGYQALGIASAGIGGALAGYDIGHSTGSAVLGAAGGALSGFELGNAIMPGIGGVVGALAGFAGGLFGASKAAKEAAAAMTELKRAEITQTLADWRAQILGTSAAQRAAAEIDLRVTYLTIRQKIEEAEAGKKMEQQRNKDLADADALYAEAQKKLTDSTDALTGSMLNAVQGYKYQAAIFGAAPSHAAPLTAPVTGNSGYTGGSGTTNGGGSGGDLTVHVTLPDGSTLATAVLKDFKKRAGQQGKTSTQWSQIQ